MKGAVWLVIICSCFSTETIEGLGALWKGEDHAAGPYEEG